MLLTPGQGWGGVGRSLSLLFNTDSQPPMVENEFLNLLFIIFFMHVCTCMSLCALCECRSLWKPEESWNPWNWIAAVFVSHPTWVLASEPRSFAGAPNTGPSESDNIFSSFLHRAGLSDTVSELKHPVPKAVSFYFHFPALK